MKKFIIPLLTAAVVVSIMLAGCVPGAAPAPAPAPAPPEAPQIPLEPSGFPQPNPYWGLGFKPDGTPYEFAVMPPDLSVDYWLVCGEVPLGQLRRSGANVSQYNAAWKLETQVSQIDDVVQKGVDGIILMPIDTAGTGPAVDKAGQAGIPVFNIDSPSMSEYMTCLCGYDFWEQGENAAKLLIDIAEQLDKHLYVYEIWCPMAFEACVNRTEGFHSIVDESPLITVLVGPACEGQDELAMNAITDAFPAHPELNAIYLNGGTFYGTKEALETLGRYHPIGNPEHIVWVGSDGYPDTLEAIRSRYMDGCGLTSPWASSDLASKALLTYVCLGKPVPRKIDVPNFAITPENVDTSPFGVPMRWGDMIVVEPDPENWPILDMEKYGMPTPTYE